MLNHLATKIENKTAVIGTIGLGYVGLPLCAAFEKAGFQVLGFDVDPEKIRLLNAGENYLKHLGDRFVAEMRSSGRFEATNDFARLAEADAILICVPTPLGEHLEPDLSYVESSAVSIAAALRPGQLVVLESTTYPGTTRMVVLPRLQATPLVYGEDYALAYSPEREDPGRQDFTTQTIPKLVGGLDEKGGDLVDLLYRSAFRQVVRVRNAEVAEAAKLLENIYRAVNIAMVNEMKVLLESMGIDVWEVVDAAATKPFGFQPFYPGPGLGGHCIPIDPFYLSWRAREVGLPTRFIELAGEINHAMPRYVVQRTVLALNSRGKAVQDSRILILGLAYKPDVDDVRESPSLELIVQLRDIGANVDFHDPHIEATHRMRHYDLKMKSVELSPETLPTYDCVVVATHHSDYEWQEIADHAELIVDTRGAMRKVEGKRDHIWSA
jgi:UDP-N-acetyl-D-glucosamine dehydrogenase